MDKSFSQRISRPCRQALQRMGRPILTIGLLACISACGEEAATPASQLVTTNAPAAAGSSLTNTPQTKPTLKIAAGFTYEPAAMWFDLDNQSVESIIATEHKHWGDEAQRQALLTADAPVSVLHLNDSLRFYNVTGQWQLATLSIVDDNDEAVWTIRLDLPPTGRVAGKIPLDLADSQGRMKLRLTMPSYWAEGNPIAVMLHDREIGTSAEPLDNETALAMGYGTSESWEGRDTKQFQELIHTDHEAVAGASLLGQDIQGNSSSSEITSNTFSWDTRYWKALVLGERSSEFASHDGKNGNPPAEDWWVALVLGTAEANKQSAALIADR